VKRKGRREAPQRLVYLVLKEKQMTFDRDKAGSPYGRVPKPARLRNVPHLGDMPVPWVTCYSQDQFKPGSSPLGDVMACDCAPGVGKAGLGEQCPVRQRRAMLERRCNACGERISGTALFAGVFFAELDAEDRPVPITAEAPTHAQCLGYSALVCPGLTRSPEKCLVFSVRGAYPLMDRWLTVTDELEIVRRYMPHDTPRPHGFVLDYVYARLDLPGQTTISLADWMLRHAPHEYRTLWTEER
jgi:hypothetical protein